MRDVLLGCTGSIGIVKLPSLALQLHSLSYTITIVLTSKAEFFVYGTHRGSVRAYDSEGWHQMMELVDKGVIKIVRAADEWGALEGTTVEEGEKGKEGGFYCPVLHITLRDTHKLLLIAPLGANSLAKFSNGLCDDTLSCVVRAWEVREKGAVVAPAMNTQMWEHPVTGGQVRGERMIKDWERGEAMGGDGRRWEARGDVCHRCT